MATAKKATGVRKFKVMKSLAEIDQGVEFELDGSDPNLIEWAEARVRIGAIREVTERGDQQQDAGEGSA